MKRAELFMKKLWLENEKLTTHIDLKNMCLELEVEYDNIIRYLLGRGYLIRIFRGIFYVRSPEEIKMKKNDLNYREILAKGLKIKGIENWYFGLYTALRLNGATHEYFPVDFIINDKIFRAKETKIANHRFKFTKIKQTLFFGIKKTNEIRYSDFEKTILDFIYLRRYRGIPDAKIVLDIGELAKMASIRKMLDYSKRYPKTVRRTLELIR